MESSTKCDSIGQDCQSQRPLWSVVGIIFGNLVMPHGTKEVYALKLANARETKLSMSRICDDPASSG